MGMQRPLIDRIVATLDEWGVPMSRGALVAWGHRRPGETAGDIQEALDQLVRDGRVRAVVLERAVRVRGMPASVGYVLEARR